MAEYGREAAQQSAEARVRPWPGERPIDLRYVQGPHWDPGTREPDLDVWVRADGALPDDPLLHSAVVAYASDFMLLGTSTLPHRAVRTRRTTPSTRWRASTT